MGTLLKYEILCPKKTPAVQRSLAYSVLCSGPLDQTLQKSSPKVTLLTPASKCLLIHAAPSERNLFPLLSDPAHPQQVFIGMMLIFV